MPNSFCAACGLTHDTGDLATCTLNKLEGTSTTRATRRATAERMAKTSGKEDMADVTAKLVSLSLAERRKIAARDIEELELEAEVSDMEERRERLMAARERRRRIQQKEGQDGAESHDSWVDTGAPDPTVDSFKEAHAGVTDTSNDSKAAGHSTYGRSRKRSRERRRRHRSSSGSSSRSASRRRKSKWALKKFTIAGKEVRKLNCYELIGATTLWALGVKELTLTDAKAVLEHINFLANRAMHNDFLDTAHIEYDLSIRIMAEEMGFSAFSSTNQRASVVFYGSQNMKTRQPGVKAGGVARRPLTSQSKRACYAWNSDTGCSRSEEECRFSHLCSKCGQKGHKRQKCKE